MRLFCSIACPFLFWLLLGIQPAQALVNSKPVSDAEFDADYPWLVAVVHPETGGICGGVLIAPGWVLTAAHCAAMKKVILTGNAVKAEAQRIEVARSIRHPEFSRQTLQHDVGLLQLAEPVDGPFAPLPTLAEARLMLLPDRTATIFGWGRTEAARTPVERVHKGTVKLEQLAVGGTQIGYRYYGGGPCGRDSGSPMLLQAPDGGLRVIGLASATDGDLCNKGGGAAVYTNIAAVLDFIERFVAGAQVLSWNKG